MTAMPIARTLLAVSFVTATLDILEMGLFAQVSQHIPLNCYNMLPVLS